MNTNSIKKICLSAQAIAVASVFFAHAAYAETKIAVINSVKILAEANISKDAQAKIRQEVTQREKELDKMDDKIKGMIKSFQTGAAKMSDEDKQKRQQEINMAVMELNQKQAQFQNEAEKMRRSQEDTVFQKVDAIIKTIATQEKYDIVVQDPVYAASSVDISDKVISILNRK